MLLQIRILIHLARHGYRRCIRAVLDETGFDYLVHAGSSSEDDCCESFE